jgi:transcriptional regulator GlxA family with amidase domain
MSVTDNFIDYTRKNCLHQFTYLYLSNTMKPQIKVAVLIYSGVELVDMNGPIDVFLHANRYQGNRPFDNPRYKIYTVAATSDPIKSEGGAVTITPDYNITNCPDPNIVVIPGRIAFDKDSTSIPADQPVIDWIGVMALKYKTILSVCVGLFSLAPTGLLDGKKATTHYLAINYAHKTWPKIHFVKNVRFIEDGHFVTTGGITSGIDGALYLVEKNDDAIVAQQVADVMVYNREAPLPPYTILPPYYSI